jgi:hypothetical protein
MSMQKFSRREFLKSAGAFSSAAFLLGSGLNNFGRGLPAVRMARAQMGGGEFMPDAEVSITAAEKFVQILSGAQTRVWRPAAQRNRRDRDQPAR